MGWKVAGGQSLGQGWRQSRTARMIVVVVTSAAMDTSAESRRKGMECLLVVAGWLQGCQGTGPGGGGSYLRSSRAAALAAAIRAVTRSGCMRNLLLVEGWVGKLPGPGPWPDAGFSRPARCGGGRGGCPRGRPRSQGSGYAYRTPCG